jgi:adenylate cyclase
VGDLPAVARVARIALSRAEKALALDPNNAAAISYGATALAYLGEPKRFKEWMKRALLIDPDNMKTRYNFACALTAQLKDTNSALELLGPVFEKMAVGLLNHSKADPDLDPLRNDPRFQRMVAGAETRLRAAENEGSAPVA